MRHEPTQLSLTTTSKRLRARETARTAEVLRAADAQDAAFEEYSRVDLESKSAESPRGTSSQADNRSMTKSLISDIATQLAVLDRQREQLAALLRDVDTNAI